MHWNSTECDLDTNETQEKEKGEVKRKQHRQLRWSEKTPEEWWSHSAPQAGCCMVSHRTSWTRWRGYSTQPLHMREGRRRDLSDMDVGGDEEGGHKPQ